MADANVAVTQVTIAGLTVAAINYLKGTKWFASLANPAVYKTVSRGLSALVAALAAVGVTYTWNSADHTLTIAGLTLTAVWAGVWAWLKQMTLNEIIFQTTKPKSDPRVVEAATGNGVAGAVPLASNQGAKA